MRIDAFLAESPMFAITRAARRFDALATQTLSAQTPGSQTPGGQTSGAQGLSFLEALVLAAIFFESPQVIKPSHLAETFGTTRGNVSHCVSSLEARGLIQRKIDPADARAYHLHLKPQGKRAALQVIGALDRLQRGFEKEVGKSALTTMLTTLRKLEAASISGCPILDAVVSRQAGVSFASANDRIPPHTQILSS